MLNLLAAILMSICAVLIWLTAAVIQCLVAYRMLRS